MEKEDPLRTLFRLARGFDKSLERPPSRDDATDDESHSLYSLSMKPRSASPR